MVTGATDARTRPGVHELKPAPVFMRLFVAVDLPEAIKAALSEEQRVLRTAAALTLRRNVDIKWTRPEGVHLTLKFLGEIPVEQVTQVTQALAELGSFEPFALQVKGFGFFPDARRPRVLWVGVEAPPALGQLAQRVETAMNRLGLAAEDRTFSPHLTLARFKVPRPQPELLAQLEPRRGVVLGRFEVSEFFLFESRLSSCGAQYQKVARFPPPSGGAG
jgi:RNA 2',3'-cyclic 3'-phosphodiesterase